MLNVNGCIRKPNYLKLPEIPNIRIYVYFNYYLFIINIYEVFFGVAGSFIKQNYLVLSSNFSTFNLAINLNEDKSLRCIPFLIDNFCFQFLLFSFSLRLLFILLLIYFSVASIRTAPESLSASVVILYATLNLYLWSTHLRCILSVVNYLVHRFTNN